MIRPISNTISLISTPEISTDLLWGMVIVFLILAAVLFFSVFHYRNKFSLNSRRVVNKKKELAPLISEFVFYTENGSKEEKSSYLNQKIFIRELLKDDFNRKILASTLIDLKRDVSGETQNQLIELYINLGLHEDAYKKLKSWRWEVVAQGILELSQMQVTDAYSLIIGFLNDKRSIIRKQAELATVSLKNDGISYFLDTTTHTISEWQQLTIMDILKNTKDFNPPKFSAWLTSRNKHVVLFSIRLIKHYSQSDANSLLIELLKHKNKEVQEEAIECLKKFNEKNSIDTLKLVFWRASKDVKIAILGAIAEMGSEDDIEFLTTIQNKRMDYLVKSKALSAINSIRPQSVLPTDGIEDTTTVIIPEDDPMVEEAVKIEPLTEVLEDVVSAEVEHEQIPEKVETTEHVQEEVKEEINDEKIDVTPEPIIQEDDLGEMEHSFTLDFLPRVVSEQAERVEETIPTQYEELQVEFEEVIVETNDVKTNISMKDKLDAVEISEEELSFLPYIVDEEAVPHKTQSEETELKSLKDLLQILDTAVNEEMTQNPQSNAELKQQEVVEKQEEEAHASQSELNKEIEVSEVMEEIQDKEIEVEDIEEIDVESEEYIDWNSLLTPQELEKKKKEHCDSTHYEEIPSGYSIIPRAYQITDDTADLIRLLTDIEELGDKREIPYLTELLSEQKSKFIIERIEEIIFKFNAEESQEKTKNPSSTIIEEPLKYSVFEELFARCDTDSKLLLMDEMLEIGDDKEVTFLNKLIHDDKEVIREKAACILSNLEEKLNKISQENDIEVEIDLSESSISDFISDRDEKEEEEELLAFADEFVIEKKEVRGIENCMQKTQHTLDTMIIEPFKTIQAKILNQFNG